MQWFLHAINLKEKQNGWNAYLFLSEKFIVLKMEN